jgi:septum formation protein
MLNKRLNEYRLILASQSPRRQYLMREVGLEFEVLTTNVKEIYPEDLPPAGVARYLAELKADSFDTSRQPDYSVIITADTIVYIDREILGKPDNYHEAVEMLRKLSGRKHEGITAVCLKSREKRKTFHVVSSVYFKELTMDEIDYYIENFQPFDKAGGYGIQEWIGYIGISKIEGSFFNIMGLPVKELYEELLAFCSP